MKELNDSQILEHLKKNTLLRNNQLSILIKLLNSQKENAVLAIDGAWGSGKTVFVKQLLMLADESIEDYGRNTLDDSAVKKFRHDQQVYYFNAWENDYLGDPLSAILLKLIADNSENLAKESIMRAVAMVKLSAGIKNVTHDFIDLNANTKKTSLVKNVQKIVDRHDEVNNILSEMINKTGKKRLVFVIDELDRCKPSFAVELLEVIKHYFIRDDVTFILAINTNELAHTIKKYYGHEFDGYTYLNKFFDFSFGLKPVEIESYARPVLGWETGGMVVYDVAFDAIKHFGLEMRETNAYYAALNLVKGFLNRNSNRDDSQWSVQLIFVPLALALKSKNDSRFNLFITGGGSDILRQFLPSSYSALLYTSKYTGGWNRDNKEKSEKAAIDFLVTQYEDLFKPNSSAYQAENILNFKDVVSLMSNYTVITEPEDEKRKLEGE